MLSHVLTRLSPQASLVSGSSVPPPNPAYLSQQIDDPETAALISSLTTHPDASIEKESESKEPMDIDSVNGLLTPSTVSRIALLPPSFHLLTSTSPIAMIRRSRRRCVLSIRPRRTS